MHIYIRSMRNCHVLILSHGTGSHYWRENPRFLPAHLNKMIKLIKAKLIYKWTSETGQFGLCKLLTCRASWLQMDREINSLVSCLCVAPAKRLDDLRTLS